MYLPIVSFYKHNWTLFMKTPKDYFIHWLIMWTGGVNWTSHGEQNKQKERLLLRSSNELQTTCKMLTCTVKWSCQIRNTSCIIPVFFESMLALHFVGKIGCLALWLECIGNTWEAQTGAKSLPKPLICSAIQIVREWRRTETISRST